MKNDILKPKKEKKIKITKGGRHQKSIRKFNGKYYVRVFSTPNETIAANVKNNLRGKGRPAILTFTGQNYLVWSRTPKKGDKLYERFSA